MKLNSTLVEQTLNQFNAQAIPESHPAIPQLNGLFGNHTFFLNGDGLHIMEPDDDLVSGESHAARVVKLASWNDEERTSLSPHDPEPTELVVLLDRH